ncbi:MAG: hypothetical protein VX675_04800 [Planctomycetota bacterium]|nr:hypothetical protein [Planctomycetota bacterium]
MKRFISRTALLPGTIVLPANPTENEKLATGSSIHQHRLKYPAKMQETKKKTL